MSDSTHLSLRRLADLLDIDEHSPRLWRDADLSQVLAHQLQTPLEEDLEGLAKPIPRAASARGRSPTFGELFQVNRPALELLEMTKDFAKQQMAQQTIGLPTEVASVLYYASIAAALVRLSKRITTLDDGALRTGLEWVCDAPWVDAQVRDLCRSALLTISPTVS
jgi:hypothetical protein